MGDRKSEKRPSTRRTRDKQQSIPQPTARTQLRFETLEDRVTPATFIWTGAGGNSLWSNAANWQTAVAPTGLDPADDLVFGPSAVKTTINDLGSAVFNSITINSSDYIISGNPFTLGNVALPSSGNIVVSANAGNNFIFNSIQLGGAGAGNRQFVNVGNGGVLTMAGSITGTTGVELTKEGTGVLSLAADNSGFTGAIRVNDNAGILVMRHVNSLGNTAGSTTIGTNAQLQINGAGGSITSPILENIIINGLGVANDGAILNTAGFNTWAGGITLDSNSVLGASNDELRITGLISDLGSGHSITKEGGARVVFARDNTYRGQTIINNGTLSIETGRALGAQGSLASGTVVNQSLAKVGTLEMYSPDVAGFTVLDEFLTINGVGVAGFGALHSNRGLNEWAAPVTIGSSAPDGRNARITVTSTASNPAQLIISGVIDNANGVFNIEKTGNGQLIFNNSNTYFGTTLVSAGILTIRDSLALGNAQAGTTVASGATLRYEIDSGFDPHGRNLAIDSVTGVGDRLTVPENLTLSGRGVSNVGALHSFTGINIHNGTIILAGVSSIGVDLDPTPNADESYFTLDYSLTVNGVMFGAGGNFSKLRNGHLILNGANDYTNVTDIEEGWITAEHRRALGGDIPTLGETRQPPTFVRNGAALHIKGLNPGDDVVNMPEILILEGSGITHPNMLISQKGALMSIGGNNSIGGDILLNGIVGIGVEQVFAGVFSELTTTGFMRDILPPFGTTVAGGVTKFGTKRLQLQGPGIYTGENLIAEGVLRVQHDSALGTSDGGTTVADGAAIEFDNGIAINNGGLIGGVQVLNEDLIINSTGNNTNGPFIQPITILGNGDHRWRGDIALNNSVFIDVGTDARFSIMGVVSDNTATASADIIKIGAGELVLGGQNTYRGATYINTGIVTLLNGQGLGSTTAGTVVADGATLQLQGNITVAGEALTVSGSGAGVVPDTMPIRWFANGPAPVTNGNAQGNPDVSGRVTGVAIDPTDANVIYISTAGGGAWKTKDGGTTWLPLIDQINDINGNPIANLPVQTLYMGSIMIAPTEPRTIYIGMGEGNNSFDSFPGNGILKSTDRGVSWELIFPTDIGGNNLFAGKVINKIVGDPLNDDSIYVAVGNAGDGSSPPGNNGIWRLARNFFTNNLEWTNLTANVSQVRQNAMPPITVPGPDDNLNISFTGDENFTDVSVFVDTNQSFEFPPGSGNIIFPNRIIMMSIGNADGDVFNVVPGMPPTRAYKNGAYISVNGGNSWTLNGIPTTETQNNTQYPVNGNMRVELVRNGTGFIAYAVSSYPSEGFNTTGEFPFNNTNANRENQIRNVYRTTIVWNTSDPNPANWRYDVAAWTTLPAVPDFVTDLNAAGLTRGRGDYALSLTVNPTNPNNLFLAGVGQTGGRGMLQSTDGGQNWTDVGVGTNGIGVHSYVHDLVFDAANQLYLATDGGLFTRTATGGYNSLNGNLAITQFNDVATANGDFNLIIGGTQSQGVALFTGDVRWREVLDGNGGTVYINPVNPNIMYAIRETTSQTLLMRSLAGGADGTWTILQVLSDPLPLFQAFAPDPSSNVEPTRVQRLDMAFDQVNPARLVYGYSVFDPSSGVVTRFLNESLNFGTNAVNLQNTLPITARVIALGTYQGDFVADPGFPLVTDVGADTYVPGTIWVSNQDQIWLTKNSGTTWVNRSVPGFDNIDELIVDPRNHDVAYAVSADIGATIRVVMTTDGGRNWTNITGNLPPNVGIRAIVIDPRTSSPTGTTGDLYVGAGNGVYYLAAGTTTWTRFGNALPNVQVADLELNTNTNVLTAGTYGRGIFQYFLPNYQANGGALRAVSGNSVWTGSVTLTGNTTINALGSQELADGSAAASLNILGVISDSVPGANNAVTKIGGGTVTFSGSNTYSGTTLIQEGVLRSNNRTALGAPGNGTTVVAGAALELQTNLDLEPITINGDGFSLNGHNTGALRNSANANTYTGPLTLGSNSTIGVDTGSQLTISNVITDGAGTFNLTKELTGTLILNGANTYDGTTAINQGVIRATNNNSLGSAAAGTSILTGAQLQLSGGITLNEAISLAGTGLFGTGALQNLDSNNTINGAVTFANLPAFSPTTPAPGQVVINVINAADTLTINGDIGQTGGTFGFNKIGQGRLTLSGNNTYAGLSDVQGGTLRVQSDNALGTTAAGTIVRAGTALEIDGGAGINIPAEQLTLNGTGPAGAGSLINLTGVNTYAGNVILQTSTTINTPAGSLNITGVVQDPTPAPAIPAGLTKRGGSILELSGANTYQGGTAILEGVVVASNNTALGAPGSAGTNVANGASLVLNGNITVANEQLTISGNGLVGNGALDNLAGNNTWQQPINLAGNTSIGSQAGTLNIDNAITDGTSNFNLTKVGPGTVSFNGTVSNAYDGPTTVTNGMLILNKTGGATNFNGSLTIGDNLAGPATVQLNQSSQIPDTSTVIVNSDGTLDLNGNVEAVSDLQVRDGNVTTGAGNGVLNVSMLQMTGGTVQTGSATGAINLIGNVMASSSANGSAAISGPGTVSLAGATRFFTVNDGPQAIDLAVNSVVAGVGAEGLVKAGTGTMQLNAVNTYTGVTSVTNGNLEVNGAIDDVFVTSASGTLSGVGMVGDVSGGSPIQGIINPGQNTVGGIGTLNVASLDLSSASTLFFNINGVTPGSQHDVINVNGPLNLNGANLSGMASGVVVGNTITIINATGPITGRFAEPIGPGVVVLGGVRFSVDYSTANQVRLTRIPAAASIAVSSTAITTVFGQPLSFTAVVTPDTGALGTPPTGTVNFNVTNGSASFVGTVPVGAGGVATFAPPTALLPGVYSVVATFNGDINYPPVAATLTGQTVNVSTTTTTVSVTPTSNVGDNVAINVSVAGQFPTPAPQGFVNLSINGSAPAVLTLVNGQASFNLNSLPVGTNTITATYLANDPTGGFSGSAGSGQVTVTAPVTPPVNAPKQVVAFGADGGGSRVVVQNAATGQQTLSFFAYAPQYTGGVRIAMGDINGDGTLDVITGTGVGGGPNIKVFDGKTGAEFRSFFAFDPGFTGGTYVASGDVTGDGRADIIVGAGEGAGPNVKVFDGVTGAEVRSFFAYAPSFTGGVRVAVGDTNGDGFADIITGAASLSTHVRLFDGRTLGELQSFFAFAPAVTGGVSVAAGDINGDGLADIITTPGSGGPHVRAFNASNLAELASFFAFEGPVTKGVRVAVTDANSDGKVEIIATQGFGGRARRIDPITGAVLSDTLPFGVESVGLFVG